jgi:TolA-binding protein
MTRLYGNRVTRSILPIALGLLWSVMAAGIDTSNDHKKAAVGVEKRESKMAKEAKAARAKPRERTSRAEMFTAEVEKKLIGEIEETNAYMRKTVRTLPKNSATRFTLQDKILQGNLENAVYVANEEARAYDQAYENWESGGRRGREPQLNSQKSRRLWQDLVDQAALIQREYPRSPKIDVTLFNQALGLQFLGKEKDAARIYSQLIQRYPNSSAAGDAYFSLGEFHFDRQDYRNALDNYSKALRYKQSKRYGWAMFKVAWCHYNLGHYKDALNYWKNVIAYTRTAPSDQSVRLKEEALRDMVYAFAELKDVEGAISYYKTNGGQKYIGSLLKLLAETLYANGQFVEAVRTLKRFQQEDPYHESCPETQKDLIEILFSVNQYSQGWAELARFGQLYGPSSAWSQKHSDDRKLVLETQAMIKDQILYYAKLAHKTAQKDDSVSLYREATRGYELFLKTYPNAPETAEVKYNMADIEYFGNKNFREAGQLYTEITLMGKEAAYRVDFKSQKRVSIHKDSAVYMVDAYAYDFQPEFKIMLKDKPDFSKAGRPLGVRAQNYIKACGTFGKFYPEDKKVIRTCDIDAAKIYYRTGNREQAIKGLWMVATKYPNEKEGPLAVEDIMALYFGSKDEKALLLAVDKLLKIPQYQKGELGNKLRSVQVDAEKNQIAQEKDPLKQGKAYEEFVAKHPGHKEGDALLNNAGVAYLSAGAVPQAIGAYMALIKNYPNSPASKRALLDVAQLYQKRFDLATAATYFASFAQKYPKEKETKDSLYLACHLQLVIESPQAEASCRPFMQKYPTESKDIVEQMIVAAERNERYAQMAQIIQQVYFRYKLSANERVIALNRVYRAGKGKSPEAIRAGQEMLQIARKEGGAVSGEALRYAAGILFRQADAGLQAYLSLKLAGGNVETVVKTMNAKEAALLKVKKGYEDVAATKDAYWGVAALHQIAYAFENYVQMLENPPPITGARMEDVRAQLEPKRQEIAKSMKATYAEAMTLVTKFRVYNEWAPRVVTAVARMEGRRLAFKDVVPMPDFIGADAPEAALQGVVTGGGR